jgi:glycine betaine/proline transport system ATP-binding protein
VLGVARDDRLALAVRDGVEEVGDVLVQEYGRVGPQTPLIGLSGLAARFTVPVAVTDDERHLLGVVPRAALLASLSGEELAHA